MSPADLLPHHALQSTGPALHHASNRTLVVRYRRHVPAAGAERLVKPATCVINRQTQEQETSGSYCVKASTITLTVINEKGTCGFNHKGAETRLTCSLSPRPAPSSWTGRFVHTQMTPVIEAVRLRGAQDTVCV